MTVFCYTHGCHYDEYDVCQDCVKEFMSRNDKQGFIHRSIRNITKTYIDDHIHGGLNKHSPHNNGMYDGHMGGLSDDEERELET